VGFPIRRFWFLCASLSACTPAAPKSGPVSAPLAPPPLSAPRDDSKRAPGSVAPAHSTLLLSDLTARGHARGEAQGELSTPVRSCVVTSPERCFNALDDNCNGLIDEGCGVTSGLLQVVVAWAEPGVDVDLWVTDPAERVVEVGKPSEGGLIKERDCPGRSNECRGQNFENVVLESGRELMRGRYRVTVRVEDLADAEEPIRVTLSARLGPKVLATEFTLAEEKEERQFTLVL
jgi:hypothetical protein